MMGPMIKSGLTIHITSENVDGAYIRITRRILEQFGAFVVLDGSDYHVPSNSTFQCPTYAIIKTYDDHRFAMAFTLLGLKADGITIDDPLCCRKTFENYFEVLDELLLYMKC